MRREHAHYVRQVQSDRAGEQETVAELTIEGVSPEPDLDNQPLKTDVRLNVLIKLDFWPEDIYSKIDHRGMQR